MQYEQRTRDQHFSDSSPKRILSLDGGGVRGVLTLVVLSRIESLLRERHGAGEDFRLCHYFDLIAGTSTGAIIAAALASGLSVGEVQARYRRLAREVFKKSLFRQGFLRAKYERAALEQALKDVFGVDRKLGSSDLKTGLLVMLKRLDTGSPWPVSNNPRGTFFGSQQTTAPNKDYPLWSVVRASTAAPAYFDPEYLVIAKEGGRTTSGVFVDGGVSTANNPALAAFRFATIKGYNVGWEPGADKLLLVSVGTGLRNPAVMPSNLPGLAAVQSLLSLMDDCNAEVETMLQWMSHSDTGRSIDLEIGALEHDSLGHAALLTYQRYNVELSEKGLNGELGLELEPIEIDALQEMDAPENVRNLERVGQALAERVLDSHFPERFDLGKAGISE